MAFGPTLAKTSSSAKENKMIQFRYVRRTLWRWQQYAAIGMDKEQAVKIAKENHDVYDQNWLQASGDGGATWVDAPAAKTIPVVDDTEAVSGKVWGG